MQSAQEAVRRSLGHIVKAEDLRLVSSKSWRQAGATWGAFAGLTPSKLAAFGNWTDKKADADVSLMPWRYHSAKYLQATTAKQAFRSVVQVVCKRCHPEVCYSSQVGHGGSFGGGSTSSIAVRACATTRWRCA